MKKWTMIIGAVVFVYVVSTVIVVHYYATEEPELIDEPIEISVESIPVEIDTEPIAPEPPLTGDIAIKGSPTIAPIAKTENPRTFGEVRELAANQGPVFCQQLENQDYIDECIDSYYFAKAERETNPDLCDKLNGEFSIKRCKANAIITKVALTYYEESDELNNPDVIPSNIELCDLLEDEGDRTSCKDPAYIIEKDYNKINYKMVE